MRVRSQTALRIGIAAFCTAVLFRFLASSLSMFDLCRVFYRTHQTIQDSLHCQIYDGLNNAVVVLFLIGSVAIYRALGLSKG
jgi:hypothetical protein